MPAARAEVWCLQGEAGDQFYIVKEGEAIVYQSTPQGVKTVNRLFKADYFGERALLTQEPRCPALRCFHSPVIVAL
jgi:cGMP-dependent protein kinase 2